jgi:hypothetical protein
MIRRRAVVVSLLAICIAVSGCSQERPGSGVGMKIGELEAKLSALEATVGYLTKRLNDLDFQQALLRSASERYRTATFDPADKGYARLDTSGGTFLVSVDDAKPFLEGYKLVLKIGNIQAVRYSSYTLKTSWGEKWDSGKQNYQKWRESLKTKEFRQTEQLVPGTWNRVELTLSPAKAAEIGYLEIEMVTDVVSMTQPR